MRVILTAAALSFLCLVLCIPALTRSGRRRYALWGALFVFVLSTSTDLRRIIPIPAFPGHYNWAGKLFELIVSLIALALLIGLAKWKREEFGLRLAFNAGTGRAIVRFLLPVLLIELVALWFLVPAGVPSIESHFFQLIAPGITEELAFRGVLLALLDRAFAGRVCLIGAPLGRGTVITSLLFGLWHGLDVDAHLHPTLEVAPMVIPTLGGFVLAWCRARSGSLLLPILAHSGMNEVANLIALIKAEM
jgi:membrane protease YdiL (CAAX protease family)